MNYHLLSFIGDIVSWLIVGHYLAILGVRIVKVPKRRRQLFILMVQTMAMLGGLHALISRALPATGMSLYHFLSAVTYSLVYITIAFLYKHKRYVKKTIKFMQTYISLLRETSFGGRM